MYIDIKYKFTEFRKQLNKLKYIESCDQISNTIIFTKPLLFSHMKFVVSNYAFFWGRVLNNKCFINNHYCLVIINKCNINYSRLHKKQQVKSFYLFKLSLKKIEQEIKHLLPKLFILFSYNLNVLLIIRLKTMVMLPDK